MNFKNNYKKKYFKLIEFFLCILFCNLSAFSQSKDFIKKVNITFKVNPIIDINSCIYWHVDFSQLKNSVVFKNHIISVGLYGGLLALNTDLKVVNVEYSKKLNSDLYTNIAVRHDTLFAEKFNQIYYLNEIDTSWVVYQLKEPIVLFDILFEDEKYVFYTISKGEFGNILYIYDKQIKKLRAIRTDCDVNCVISYNNLYFAIIDNKRYNFCSNFLKLKAVELVNIVSEDSTEFNHFKILPVTDNPKFDNQPSIEKDVFIPYLHDDYGAIVKSTFFIGKNQYYIVDLIKKKFDFTMTSKTFIAEIIDEKFIIIDSIDEFYPQRTRVFNEYTLLDGFNGSRKLGVIIKDSIIFIDFKGSPDYSFEYNPSTIVLNNKKVVSNFYEEFITFEPQYTRKFQYNLTPSISINSFDDATGINLTLAVNNNARNLKLNSKWNVIVKAFKYQKNNFIYFFNLGNIDHKYGLLEIYDTEKFIENYCE